VTHSKTAYIYKNSGISSHTSPLDLDCVNSNYDYEKRWVYIHPNSVNHSTYYQLSLGDVRSTEHQLQGTRKLEDYQLIQLCRVKLYERIWLESKGLCVNGNGDHYKWWVHIHLTRWRACTYYYLPLLPRRHLQCWTLARAYEEVRRTPPDLWTDHSTRGMFKLRCTEFCERWIGHYAQHSEYHEVRSDVWVTVSSYLLPMIGL